MVSCASVPKYQIEKFKPGFHHDQSIVNVGDRFLYIDNTQDHWYTFEFEAEKVTPTESNQFFFMDSTFTQVNSVPFCIGDNYSVMGSRAAEDYALFKHIRWERNFQAELAKQELDSSSLDYDNKRGKLFKIWWFIVPESEDELYPDEPENPEAISHEVSFMLFLEFIVHGDINASIGITVLENEDLNQKITVLKKIADSFKFYGYFIDKQIAVDRIINDSYIFEDKQKKFSMEIPKSIKITIPEIDPEDNMQMFTLPEKENIINAITFNWFYADEFESFENFSKVMDGRTNISMENPLTLSSTAQERRLFYNKSAGYFYCQQVLLKRNNMYFSFYYTATETTYDFNLASLNELIDNLK